MGSCKFAGAEGTATSSLKLFPLVCHQAQRCLAIAEASALGTPLFAHGGDGEIGVLFAKYFSSSLKRSEVFMGWLMVERRSAATPACSLVIQDPRDVLGN